MTANIDVVAIALFEPTTQKYLIVRRGPGQGGAGFWEFPGGKIEEGETQTVALRREIQEELGIVIDVSRLLYIGHHVHAYETKVVHLDLFKYEIKDPVSLVLTEHDQFAWCLLGEIKNYPLSAADIPFLEKLSE